jgi:hypothetical protein
MPTLRFPLEGGEEAVAAAEEWVATGEVVVVADCGFGWGVDGVVSEVCELDETGRWLPARALQRLDLEVPSRFLLASPACAKLKLRAI